MPQAYREFVGLLSEDMQAMFRRIEAVADGELTELPQAQNIYREARSRDSDLQKAYLAFCDTLERAGVAIATNWAETEETE